MAYTTAAAPDQPGPSPDNWGMIHEDITVTGAGDTTGTYVTQFVKQPLYVIGGPFTYSISGQTVTLSSAALTGVAAVRIIGFA